MRMKNLVIGTVLAVGLASGAQAAAIDLVAYTQVGNALINFEDVVGSPYPGTVYNALFVSGGATFGERFAGQTLSFATDTITGAQLDVLSGAPVGPLTLIAGAAFQNLDIGNDRFTKNLIPCGSAGCSAPNGYGEGAFAVMFAGPVSYFGLQQLYGDGSGLTTLDFFNTSGGLIQRISVATAGSFGFARAGGVSDIAGVSVFSSDPGGLGYDNLVYRQDVAVPGVPEPATWAMMLFGFGAMGTVLRRRPGTRSSPT